MNFLTKKSARSIPIAPVTGDTLKDWLKKQDKAIQAWVKASGFTGDKGSLLAVPGKNGAVALVLCGVGDDDSLYAYADLPAKLPKNKAGYYIDKKMNETRAT